MHIHNESDLSFAKEFARRLSPLTGAFVSLQHAWPARVPIMLRSRFRPCEEQINYAGTMGDFVRSDGQH